MSRLLLCLLLLLPSAALAAGEISLEPSAIGSGGVCLLHWHGAPPARATVRFHGREFSLWPAGDGAFALLGADLELAPGTYPVTVTGTDRQGHDFACSQPLQIRAVERPEERLSLPSEMVSPRDPATVRRIIREQKMLQQLFSAPATPPLWDGFMRPVDSRLGSRFGLRRILNGEPRSPHPGIDFHSPRGTPVRAAGRGRVVFAGELYFTGRTVILDHGAGLYSLYAHLERMACRSGDLLARGSILGKVGSTGRATGPHLHWGFKLTGDRIDPLALLQMFPIGKGLDSPPGGGNN